VTDRAFEVGKRAVPAMLQPVVAGYRQLVPTRFAGRRLRALARDCSGDVNQLVELTFGYRYRSLFHPWPFTPINIQPLQVFDELVQLAHRVRNLRPTRLLEIGTASGGTLFLWSWLSPRGAVTVSVDLPQGRFGADVHVPGNEGYPEWRTELYRCFTGRGRRVHLIKGDSHAVDTLRQVREHLKEERLDFVFIDGDHTYGGVKTDFELYSGLVKRGGMMAFHDIVKRPEASSCAVSEFWDEVRRGYRHEEIVADPRQRWAGIGVLYL
jgi:predicted O-methyltransferase YrrM